MNRLTAGLIIVGIALTGCGALGTEAPSASSAPASSPPAGSAAADAAASIHAEIGGGPLVGSYNAESTTPICTSGLAGDGSFGVQYTVDEPEGLSRLEVLIPVAALAETGTDEFTASIGIGPLSGGTTFHIDPVAGGGTGSVLLDYDGGDSATLTIEAETAEGIDVMVEVECRQVIQL